MFMILMIVFPSLSLIAEEEINKKSSLYTVGVIGNQWYWNYELNLALGVVKYVSNLVLLEKNNWEHKQLNRLLTTSKTLPIAGGIKTSFYITSNDVAHSWAVPGLGIKVDAIPGRLNLKSIIASRLGLYTGMCSELCGTDHGFMPISLKVLSFSDWWFNVKDSLEEIYSKGFYFKDDFWSGGIAKVSQEVVNKDPEDVANYLIWVVYQDVLNSLLKRISIEGFFNIKDDIKVKEGLKEVNLAKENLKKNTFTSLKNRSKYNKYYNKWYRIS